MLPLTLAPFPAGLSNQKIALAELLVQAGAQGRPARLPPIADYDGTVGGPLPLRPVHLLFDRPALEAACEALDIALVPDDARAQVLPARPFFEGGTARLRREDGAALTRLLAAMRPCASVARQIARLRKALDATALGCQLRVEPDWQRYLAGGIALRLAPHHDPVHDAGGIAAKIAATLPPGRAYATCDLGQPGMDRAALTDAGRGHGIDFVFRTDLLPDPLTPAEATLIDFEMLCSLPVIVGTSLSSFFNLATLTRAARGVAGAAWLYNAPGRHLARRTDDGVWVRPDRATA